MRRDELIIGMSGSSQEVVGDLHSCGVFYPPPSHRATPFSTCSREKQ